MISYFGLKMLNYAILPMTRKKLFKSLTSESKRAVKWLKENMMTVDPDKFQGNITDKRTQKIILTL